MNDIDLYEAVGPDIEVSPVPTNSPDPGVRALYDSDISSSIQQRFASWYYGHGGRDPRNWNNSYFMVRTGSGEYIAYFGDISEEGVISDADRLVYKQINSGGYSSAWTWSVSHVQSGRVDLDGYSGYIYSSYDQYQESPYMVEYGSSLAMSWAIVSLLILAIGVVAFKYVKLLFGMR